MVNQQAGDSTGEVPRKQYFWRDEGGPVDWGQGRVSSAHNITPGDCIVYSFGINNEYAFDPTMGVRITAGQTRSILQLCVGPADFHTKLGV
ncbi:hypothetical protein Hamer_G015501 [Homarus americanus]|uniref:Uncharacterized protein n=1 Tax=Homarus americanus TaxID=6706 RepID=A0A8J5NBK6_HOMAM|nr:hypothetical protein Hamer_G015501 [Homarus americanus]